MTDETKNTYPLGIRPNPDYYVPNGDEIEKIEDFIEKTDGAVIGLTGVRGSGKSTLIDKIVSKYEIKDESTTKKEYFTLKITSPTGYDEKEFFIMVFKRLCEGVIKKIEERMGIRKNLKKIMKEDTINKMTLRIAIVTSLIISLMLTALSSFDPYYPDSSLVYPLLYSLFGKFATIISPIMRFIIIAIICFFFNNHIGISG